MSATTRRKPIPATPAELRAIGLPETLMGCPIDYGGITARKAKQMVADMERMRRRMITQESAD